MCGSVVVAAMVLELAAMAQAPPAKTESIDFDLVYQIAAPGKTRRLRFFAAIPGDVPERQSLTVRLEPTPYGIRTIDGNRVAEFVFDPPQKSQTVTISVRGAVNGYDLEQAKSRTQIDLFSGPVYWNYLRHERFIERDDPNIQEIARSIPGDATLSPADQLKTVEAIYRYVIGHMKYRLQDRRAGAVEAAKTGIGDCAEYTDLFVALCRAKNIPARPVSGLRVRYRLTPFHAWAEVYLKEYGWVPFDPTTADRPGRRPRLERFLSLEPNYIYLRYVYDDVMLPSYKAWRYEVEGARIQVKRSVVFRKPTAWRFPE